MFAGAVVVVVGVLGAFFGLDGGSVHYGAALGAVEDAAEQVGAAGSARVVRVAGGGEAMVGGVAGLAFLDGGPGFWVDDGFAVVGNDFAACVELAGVDWIGEEGGVAVDAFVEVGGLGDLAVGGALGAHLEGELDEGDGFGVGDPAVEDVGTPVAAGADVDGFSFEAAGRGARHGSVLLADVGEAAFGVGGEVFEVALVHPVDGGFEEAAVCAGGNLVVEAVDGVSETAELGAVVLCVVDIACKSVVFPDDDTVDVDGTLAKILDHLLELVTTDGGGAGSGTVCVDVDEDEAVFAAPGGDGVELLVNGEVLVFAAGIAEVGDEVGARGEGVHDLLTVI